MDDTRSPSLTFQAHQRENIYEMIWTGPYVHILGSKQVFLDPKALRSGKCQGKYQKTGDTRLPYFGPKIGIFGP